jgi:hypothetical protein
MKDYMLPYNKTKLKIQTTIEERNKKIGLSYGMKQSFFLKRKYKDETT